MEAEAVVLPFTLCLLASLASLPGQYVWFNKHRWQS